MLKSLESHVYLLKPVSYLCDKHNTSEISISFLVSGIHKNETRLSIPESVKTVEASMDPHLH